jgi:uncharacterized protein (TIGR03083 family)
MAKLAGLLEAYDGQQAALMQWLRALPEAVADRPTRLGEWTVRDLAFHLTEVPRALTTAAAAPTPTDKPQTVAQYTAHWRASAPDIAARERAGAAGMTLAEIAERQDVESAAMRLAVLDSPDDRVVGARRGPIRVLDLLATRINELVVHSLDLTAALPESDAVPVERPALGVACRMLTSVLAERVPGHTVEVRVPPYAAVQCVEGPRHTRGTPANVVEADAVTWVELATGRAAWTDAVRTGRVRASGERSDISSLLPVLT